MPTLREGGKHAWVSMALREDGSPRNDLYFRLVRGDHSYTIWDLFRRKRRLYEVIRPVYITVQADNGDWVALEAREGFRFDGPTGYSLDYGANLGLAWLWNQAVKIIGLSGRWHRSPWLPASAHHDWPAKTIRDHARMYVNGEEVDDVPQWKSNQCFRNLLLAWGANRWSVSIAMRIITLYQAIK